MEGTVKNMKNKKYQLTIIILSLIFLAIALTQNAIIKDFNDIREPQSSLDFFLMGSTAILGGGLLEWIIWLANPLCLLAMIDLWKGKERAIIKCGIALTFAISFAFWKNILGSESGSIATVVSLQAGYYLWVMSIIVLTAGTFWYFKTGKSVTQIGLSGHDVLGKPIQTREDLYCSCANFLIIFLSILMNGKMILSPLFRRHGNLCKRY